MGCDLYIRSDAHHRSVLPRARGIDVLRTLGFSTPCSLGGPAVYEHAGLRVEAYLATVEQGGRASDALDPHPLAFGEVQLHSTYDQLDFCRRMGFTLAATLGWELFDGASGCTLRDACAVLDVPSESPWQRTSEPFTKLARDLDDTVCDLAPYPHGCFVAVLGRYIDSRYAVELRTGALLSSGSEMSDAHPPLALSHADSHGARWLATGASHVEHHTRSTRVQRLLQGGELDAGTVLPLPLNVAWVPGEPAALVGLATHHDAPDSAPADCSPGPIYDALIALPHGPRLVLVDVAQERVRPFANDEILKVFYASQVAVSADAELAFVTGKSVLHAFSLRTGALLYRRWPTTAPRSLIGPLATSPCGRHVAVGGGILRSDQLGALSVYEAASGRLTLSHSAHMLGAPATSVSCLAFHPDGWLVVGFANGKVVRLSLDGRTLVQVCDLGGCAKKLSFREGYGALLVGGYGGRLLEIPMGEPRARRARPVPAHASTFDDTHDALRMARETAALSDEPSFERLLEAADLEQLAEQVRAGLEPEYRTRGTSSLLCALSARAQRRGEHLAPRFHPWVSEFAPLAKEPEELAPIVMGIAPELQACVLLARTDLPGTARYAFVEPELAAETLVGILAPLGRGAYTALSKRKDSLFCYTHGYDAKEFEQRMLTVFRKLGAGAVGPLERARRRGELTPILRKALHALATAS